MLLPLYVALAVALVFFAILPVAGAYNSRAQWRRFRERVVELSLFPRLTFEEFRRQTKDGGQPTGEYRLYGELEAMEGDTRIWVRCDNLTAVVNLESSWFHILPDSGGEEIPSGRFVPVEHLSWSRVRLFPEGAKVFVGGSIISEGGMPVFSESPGRSLIVVSYQGKEEDLLSRLIAGGRRGNEYWNVLSRISIALGIGIMVFCLAVFWSSDYFPTVIFLSSLVTLIPVLVLLPPGLAFFFLYLFFWRRGLAARTLRDLLRLPLRFFGDDRYDGRDGIRSAPLPEGGEYRMIRNPGKLAESVPVLETSLGEAGDWVLFEPIGSDDPGVRIVAVAGDPEILARKASSRALIATLASGASLGFGILLNLVAAFLLWRLPAF